MNRQPIDLAGLHHLPRNQPAPTFGPGDTPDTGPGNGDRPGPCVAFKACGCGVLAGESCDCADLAAQHEAHLDQPIFFRFNARKAA